MLCHLSDHAKARLQRLYRSYVHAGYNSCLPGTVHKLCKLPSCCLTSLSKLASVQYTLEHALHRKRLCRLYLGISTQHRLSHMLLFLILELFRLILVISKLRHDLLVKCIHLSRLIRKHIDRKCSVHSILDAVLADKCFYILRKPPELIQSFCRKCCFYLLIHASSFFLYLIKHSKAVIYTHFYTSCLTASHGTYQIADSELRPIRKYISCLSIT